MFSSVLTSAPESNFRRVIWKENGFVEGCNDINLTVNCNISRHVGYLIAIPVQTLTGPPGLQEVEAPRIYRQLVHEGGEIFSPTNP